MDNEKQSICDESVALAVVYWILSLCFVGVGIVTCVEFKEYTDELTGLCGFIAAFFFGIHGLRYYRQRDNNKYRFKKEAEDGRKVRKGMTWGIVTGLFRICFWGMLCLVIFEGYEYITATPKLSVKSSQVTVHAGDTLNAEDLVTVKARSGSTIGGSYYTYDVYMEFEQVPEEERSSYIENGKILHIGDKAETFTLYMYGQASTGETGKGVEITIIVEK